MLLTSLAAHAAQFASLSALASLLSEGSEEAALPEWESRRVERGSRIVTAVPSTMSLVLQMPRGNLETINPRPMVMNIVRQDIDRCVFLFIQVYMRVLTEISSVGVMRRLSTRAEGTEST